MASLSPEEELVLATPRRFVDEEVRPVARELEHANEYPGALIDRMKELGVFGLAIPEPWGDVERRFRDTPLMIVGEGTNEIQRGGTDPR